MRQAADYCRAGHGPALVRATVTRPYSHSLSDDERLYKPKVERDSEALRDPLRNFPEFLIRERYLDRGAVERIMRAIDTEVQELSLNLLKEPPPAAGSAMRFLYSDSVDPCSAAFQTEPQFRGDPRTMVDSINQTLAEEMRRNSRMLVFGEDVADCSRDQYLGELKGKGGVFKATSGLQREFGSDRCFNTPLAEASIIGRAIGMAARGLKPVVEIQFFDYIWPAMMQLRGELSNFRWRSNNAFSCPVVVRVPIGGYLTGRRHLSQPVWRGNVHPHTWFACSFSVKCAGRLRSACEPLSAATIRCSSWNTRSCIASLTTGHPTQVRISWSRLVRPKW